MDNPLRNFSSFVHCALCNYLPLPEAYSCGFSNVAKLFEERNMYDFQRNFFYFSNKVIYLKYTFVSPFKQLNSVKKISLYRKIFSVKQTHSVKHSHKK